MNTVGDRRSHRLLLRLAIATAILIAAIAGTMAYRESKQPTEPRITVSKETTFLTEPLDSDGFPDYQKAINARFREGVTPANNAAIPFWKAFGPNSIPKALRAKFFKQLGMQAPPDDGQSFVTMTKFTETLTERGIGISADDFYAQEINTSGQPWKAADYPAVAKWITANEKPLELIVKASRREKYYCPHLKTRKAVGISVVTETEGPFLDAARETYRILVTRAMLRIGEGQLAAAQSDLLACHRLADLYTQHPSQTAQLVGLVAHAVALKGERALLESGLLTASQLLDYQSKLRKISPLPEFGESFDFARRCKLLELIIILARRDFDDIGALVNRPSDELQKLWKRRQRKIRLEMVDWNVVLRNVNSAMDDAATVFQATDFRKRSERLRAMEEKRKQLQGETKDLTDFASGWWISRADRQGATNWFTQIYTEGIAYSAKSLSEAEGRLRMRFEFTLLAFGLRAYHANHAKYPQRLSTLIPKYAKQIPNDLFSGNPLKYKRTKAGFVLYSIGQNGKDDGSHGYDAGIPNDDIVIQFPPKSKRPHGE